MIVIVIFTLFFLSNASVVADEEGITAFESIKRLKECIDILDRSGTRTACEGREGVARDECIEKFTKKIMPTLNACIERSRQAMRPQTRDEL